MPGSVAERRRRRRFPGSEIRVTMGKAPIWMPYQPTGEVGTRKRARYGTFVTGPAF
jgi:hypothetical protein